MPATSEPGPAIAGPDSVTPCQEEWQPGRYLKPGPTGFLATSRPALEAAAERLRSADPTGRRVLSTLGGWIVLRHLHADWATGRILLPRATASAIAPIVGCRREAWPGRDALLTAADLWRRQGSWGAVIPGWPGLEGRAQDGTHDADYAVTDRAALAAMVADLQAADGSGRRWASALGVAELARLLHVRTGGSRGRLTAGAGRPRRGRPRHRHGPGPPADGRRGAPPRPGRRLVPLPVGGPGGRPQDIGGRWRQMPH
ncbi:MAG: hypothetical protein ACRD0J_13495 [Acidimicrobiales bacterium]